jgi:hypothetical protein
MGNGLKHALGVSPAKRTEKPKNKEHNQDCAKDAAQAGATPVSMSVIPTAPAKEHDNQYDNQQKAHRILQLLQT